MYKLFGLLICISLCIDFGLTASYTWTNTAGGSWSTASNWSPNGVPGANDDGKITKFIQINILDSDRPPTRVSNMLL
jgi:hypothetical protein